MNGHATAAMASETEQNAFVKQFTSSDRSTREHALDQLRAFLRSHSDLSSLDLLKIWKGLFYGMWMADRPRTQQQLARDLAWLADELPRPELVPPFFAAFWQTMAREWNGIDSLRLDKYLYLVRCYVGAGFRFCARHGWAREEAIAEYLAVLEQTPLNPTDAKVPNGMRYHVVDVYVDELENVGAGDDEGVPVERLLAPLERLGKNSKTKAVRERVKEALLDERVQRWRGGDTSTDFTAEKDNPRSEGDEEEWGGLND